MAVLRAGCLFGSTYKEQRVVSGTQNRLSNGLLLHHFQPRPIPFRNHLRYIEPYPLQLFRILHQICLLVQRTFVGLFPLWILDNNRHDRIGK